MQPFDKLTNENIDFIKAYIDSYANAKVDDLRPVLNVWNKNKRTLFKALGGELQVKIPIEVPRNTLIYHNQLNKIYYSYPITTVYEMCDFLESNYIKNTIRNEFVSGAIEYLIRETNDINTVRSFSRMLSHTNVEEGKTVRDYEFPHYNLTIRQGTKIAKAIQRVLKVAKYPDMHLFEDWRNAISNLNANRSVKANLVLSINPIDYMTMSDNNCDWSSCMSWTKDGMYSTGTIEMMNSNVAVVAYLESDTPYEVCGMFAPNKSWRTLLFVHKDIMIVGKNYPYYHEGLCQAVLHHMSKLVKHNLNWDYSFKNQLYHDLIHFESNEFVRADLSRQKMRYKSRYQDGKWTHTNRHKILCYTRLMYNDMICDRETSYWCYRNKVDKTLFLNLSGRATCMCCGEYIYDEWDNPRNEDCTLKVCHHCRNNNHCVYCNKVYQNKEHMVEVILNGRRRSEWYKTYLCKHELSLIRYYPGLGVGMVQDGTCGDIVVYDAQNIDGHWRQVEICKINADACRQLGIRGFYSYDRTIQKYEVIECIERFRSDLTFDDVIKLTRFKSNMTEQELREVGVVV